MAKDQTVFPKASLNETVMKESHPATWWTNLQHKEAIPKELVQLLVSMFNCPSSTASVERVFSTYGFIQTGKRNRLSQEKVMKLAFCFRGLRKEIEDKSKLTRKRKLLTET